MSAPPGPRVPGGAVTLRHVLRNALIPVVTLIGLQAGYLLGGAVVTETIYSWPGVGRLGGRRDPLASDFPLAQGAILVLALAFLVINLDRSTCSYAVSIRGCVENMADVALPLAAPPSPPPAAEPASSPFLRRILGDSLLRPPSSSWSSSGPCSPRPGSRRSTPTTRPADGLPSARLERGFAAAQYWLGTDGQGRDMVSRLLFGAG